MNITEDEIQAKGLTAPRITPSALQDNIVNVEIVKHVSTGGKVLRWAVVTCKNGFAVTGKPSAAVSSENDDVEIGERIAIQNAKEEMWSLMGYALSNKLAGL
jgi:Phage protein (N4 Gp49/phage Sf6 gene 66) family